MLIPPQQQEESLTCYASADEGCMGESIFPHRRIIPANLPWRRLFYLQAITGKYFYNILNIGGQYLSCHIILQNTFEVNCVKDYWGKQRSYQETNGYARRYGPENANGYAEQYASENAIEYAKQYEPGKIIEEMAYGREKHCPKPCNPPRPCVDRPCHFCGTVWRKCPCCGRCCCCKVWFCNHMYVFLCSECGEVFFADCDDGCWKK